MALGSSKKQHEVAGQAAVKKIEHAAKQVHQAIAEGSCQGAMINYAEMHNQVGVAEAHMRSANGSKIWIPSTEIQNASYEFNERCVRPMIAELNGRRKRRR
jgi:hypothetical protein